MQNEITITTRHVKIVAFVAVLGIAVYALAGNPYPDAPPGATMHSLEDIYSAVEAASVSEREGYVFQWSQEAGTTANILTVPPGKRFVLLKFVFDVAVQVQILKNGSTFIDLDYLVFENGSHVDLPDRCIVFDSGDELSVYSQLYLIKGTIVGYFYNVP